MSEIGVLLGKTIKKIGRGDDSIEIETADHTYRMYHEQDCCEHVYIDEIVGELDDLVGNQILRAEERSNSEEGPKVEHEESYTWTFYELATIKGSVTIRWYGSSSGYYSERVSFEVVK